MTFSWSVMDFRKKFKVSTLSYNYFLGNAFIIGQLLNLRNALGKIQMYIENYYLKKKLGNL